jgi:hypothetical protein
MARRLRHSLFCIILACVGLPAGALAAELGDARVVSHIGQQLLADIELTALRDEAAPVQVRLASADIYRGAGIAMSPVLSGLNLSVARRGGRQFLSVTSFGPVQSDYLHLYLELAEGSERTVRLATLWLTPDPNPAPKPAPEPKPVPKPEPAPERKAAPEPAPKSAPSPAVASVPQPALKPLRASAAPAVHAALVPASKSAAALTRAPVAVKVAPAAPAPLPLAAAKPASCPRPGPAILKTCVALDHKNAQLNAHLGQLEDKVKVLQLAMGAVPPGAKPKRAARPPVFVLRRKTAREREETARRASLPAIMPGVKKRLMPEKRSRLMPEKSAPDQVAAPADPEQE